MEGSPVGNFVAQAIIVLFFVCLTLLTLRSVFMGWMLVWSPLASLWARVRNAVARRGLRSPTD